MLPYENALRASRRVLRTLVVVNIVYGVAITGLLLLSFLIKERLFNSLGVEPAQDREAMVRGMRMVAFIGILAVPLVHVIVESTV